MQSTGRLLRQPLRQYLFLAPLLTQEPMTRGQSHTFAYVNHPHPSQLLGAHVHRGRGVNRRYWRTWWAVDQMWLGAIPLIIGPLSLETFEGGFCLRPILVAPGQEVRLTVTCHSKAPRQFTGYLRLRTCHRPSESRGFAP